MTAGERKAVVYVLADHVDGRPFRASPRHNAAEADLEEIYLEDRLDRYPLVRDRYETRALRAGETRRRSRAWAVAALDALHSGNPVPGHHRWLLQVLQMLIDAESAGVTRKEVCQQLALDGGKVSSALTTLHDAGIAFPLEGVKR